MHQTASPAVSVQHKEKGLALEVFYQLLFVGLFMQNRRTDSMQQKIAGFFVYSLLGVLGKTVSLLYHVCSKDPNDNTTCTQIFSESLKDRKWQYLTSFVLAMMGCATVFILTDSDPDGFKETGFWGFFAGLSFDLAIFFAASDIKKAQSLFAKQSDADLVQADIDSRSHVPSISGLGARHNGLVLTTNNEPICESDEQEMDNLRSRPVTTTVSAKPSAQAVVDDGSADARIDSMRIQTP